MTRYQKQRRLRNSLRFSEMGKKSQAVQSDRRMEDHDERLRELEEIEINNLPQKQGDALGCLQWTDFRSGKVRRWVVRIGDRSDRITMEAGGIKTRSHGWTWIMNAIRSKIVTS